MGKQEITGVRKPIPRERAPAPPPPRNPAPKPEPKGPLPSAPTAATQGSHAGGVQAPEGFLLVPPIQKSQIQRREPSADVSAGPGSTWIVPGGLYEDKYNGMGFALMVGAAIGKDGKVFGTIRAANDQVLHMTHGPRGEGNNMRGWVLVDDHGIEYVCPTDTTAGGWRRRAPPGSAPATE